MLIVVSRVVFSLIGANSISNGDPRTLPHPDEDWQEFFSVLKVRDRVVDSDRSSNCCDSGISGSCICCSGEVIMIMMTMAVIVPIMKLVVVVVMMMVVVLVMMPYSQMMMMMMMMVMMMMMMMMMMFACYVSYYVIAKELSPRVGVGSLNKGEVDCNHTTLCTTMHYDLYTQWHVCCLIRQRRSGSTSNNWLYCMGI